MTSAPYHLFFQSNINFATFSSAVWMGWKVMLLANKFSISELKSKSNERKSPRMHPYTYSIFMELLVWHVTENGYYFLLKTLRKIYLRCELCLLCEMSVDVCVCMHAHRFFEWDFQLRSHFVDKMTREKERQQEHQQHHQRRNKNSNHWWYINIIVTSRKLCTHTHAVDYSMRK